MRLYAEEREREMAGTVLQFSAIWPTLASRMSNLYKRLTRLFWGSSKSGKVQEERVSSTEATVWYESSCLSKTWLSVFWPREECSGLMGSKVDKRDLLAWTRILQIKVWRKMSEGRILLTWGLGKLSGYRLREVGVMAKLRNDECVNLSFCDERSYRIYRMNWFLTINYEWVLLYRMQENNDR